MSPVRLELTLFPLKVESFNQLSYEDFCLSYLSLSITLVFICLFNLVGIPGLEPGRCPLPKSGDLPISPHPVIIEEE